MENIEIIKEIQKEGRSSSTVEDTCTVYIREVDIKNESQDILEKDVKIKVENVCIMEEVSSPFVYLEVKTENTEIKGNVSIS